MAVTIHNAGQSRLKTLLILAWPAIMEQILATMVSYVDTAMVGSLGAVATAAVGINAPVTWLINGLNQSVGVGYSVQVAHAIGARDYKKARHIIIQSLLAILVCGLTLFSVMMILCGWIPRWLGVESEVLPYAVSYLRIYSCSLPFTAALMVLGRILSGVHWLTDIVGGMLLSGGLVALYAFFTEK